MGRLRVMIWLAQEERTIPYLARVCEGSVEELVAFLAGSGDGDTEMLAALEVALSLPEGDLQRDDDDVAGLQPIDGDPLRCYTVDEVAARMQVHADTVRKEIRERVLKTIRVGDRGVRIPHSALEIRLNRWERAKRTVPSLPDTACWVRGNWFISRPRSGCLTACDRRSARKAGKGATNWSISCARWTF